MRIRPSTPDDVDAISAVINDAAQAYRGVIPPKRSIPERQVETSVVLARAEQRA